MLAELFALFQALAVLFLILSIERPEKLFYPLLAMIFFAFCAYTAADITKAYCEINVSTGDYLCIEYIISHDYLIWLNGFFALACLVLVFLSYFEVIPSGRGG